VVATDGSTEERNLLRVGPFTTFDGNAFLRYIPETGELLTLNRQPSQRYLNVAKRFSKGNGEQLPMVVDPTGGSLLGMLSYTPTLRERIEQGGTIGFIIIGLGLCGLLLTLWRIIYLGSVHLAIRRQLGKLKQPCPKNPLGRVIGSVGRLSDWQHEGEGLQFKLDEAILAELPRLERAHSFIKLLAATSPLLGLLGTVTGMILTFQAISLYGSGDPKLMATGISQALITTVLGLIVAIPLLFGHNLVNSLARNMIQRLDEQSAGIMARLTEEADADQ
jgi:biopolymer transport protein ExbB